MKTAAIILAAALALAGCTTAQIEQGKALAKKSIEVVCMSYAAPYGAFESLAATGRVKQDVVNKARAAVAALEAICADPPTDTKTAIASASRVFTALLQAAADAKRQAGT